MLKRLAWRNIWRNKRRTILTAAAIAFAAGLLVFFTSLQFSSYETSINASVSIFQSHLQVQHADFLDKPEIRDTVQNVDEHLPRLRAIPGVLAAVPRAMGFVLLSSDDRSYGAQIVGVDPQAEREVSTIPGVIRSGSYLDPSDASGAVVGMVLARNLGVEVGSELTLLGQGSDGSLASSIVTVRGIFESGSPEIDRGFVEITLLAFRSIFALEEGEAHAIAIKADSSEKVREIQRAAKEAIAVTSGKHPLEVRSWQELLPGLESTIELDMAFGWIFYFSLVIIVSFGVLNTFLMSVLERTKEFGLLLALGVPPLRISILVLAESLQIALCGLAAGVLLGGCVVLYFGRVGFFVPGSEEIMKIFNIQGGVFPKLSPLSISLGPALIFFVSLLSVLYPALRVRSMEPVEALRSS